MCVSFGALHSSSEVCKLRLKPPKEVDHIQAFYESSAGLDSLMKIWFDSSVM